MKQTTGIVVVSIVGTLICVALGLGALMLRDLQGVVSQQSVALSQLQVEADGTVKFRGPRREAPAPKVDAGVSTP